MENLDSPKISVVMPVLNGEKYLAEAIESILNQTYQDFELIIVDDGSTDQTPEILRSYAQKDPRIQILTNPINRGIGYSRNRGIALSRGEYIANMDADDLCLPERFEKQVRFLDSHRDIAVLGTAYIRVDEIKKKQLKIQNPDLPGRVRWGLIFGCPICNSSVMMRSNLFDDPNLRIEEDVPPAEDYDLWVKVAQNHRIGNLKNELVFYRWHQSNVSVSHSIEQRQSSLAIIQKQIQLYTNTELPENLVKPFLHPKTVQSSSEARQIIRIYRSLIAATRQWGLNAGERIDVNILAANKIHNAWEGVKSNLQFLGDMAFAGGLILEALFIAPLWKIKKWLSRGESAWKPGRKLIRAKI